MSLQGAAIAAPIKSENLNKWTTTRTNAHNTVGAIFDGSAPDQEPVSIVVALKLQNKDFLDQYTRELFHSGSPYYHKWMSSKESTAKFAPTPQQAQAVADYLFQMGFTNIQIADNRLIVSAYGTVGSARRAFRTEIGHFTRNGRSGIANTLDIQVPSALSDQVEYVLGLQTLDRPHTNSRPVSEPLKAANPAYGITASGAHYYYPQEFATVYNAGNTPTASNTEVAIVGWGSMANAVKDLEQFETDKNINAVPTAVVSIGNPSNDDSMQAEWAMDAQAIVGISGGVKKLTFYAAADSTNANLLTAINRAVSDNTAKVINLSWGECETGTNGWADAAFQLGVTQGQTFAVASGDHGAYDCGGSAPNGAYGTTLSVQYPASSAYVVAVGGTTLNTSADDAYLSESTWPYSGGGVSQYTKMPSWQTNSAPGSYRRLPDLAFDADWTNSPMSFYLTTSPDMVKQGVSSSGYYTNGGTSLASPLFVGAWARLESAHNNGLGFAAPALYTYASTFPFHDVTTGNNGYYTAVVGRDSATGWGSFDIQRANDFITNTPGFTTSSNQH
ncbi:protease pro-enzyme activation domain-containing protein [Burkholderia sp. RF4-BP95]|uniref:S53 family peptidase n=1 Tax=Burkholderia sp. RF4-BP95 TaxID=1637845 RepID=UPI000A8BACE1|nr:S53 family peptidase [Burkholderia sp. RF4-BP95]